MSSKLSEDSNTEYEVEAVLDDKIETKRKKNGKCEYITKYKVKWVGYPSSESTWEPLENLAGCRETLQDYLNKKKIRAQSPVHMINKKTKLNEFENESENENFEELEIQENSSINDNISNISNQNKKQCSTSLSSKTYNKKNKKDSKKE